LQRWAEIWIVDANGDTYHVLYFGDGNKQVDGTSSAYGASYTTNDVIGVAVDVDNNQITFYKNGASQGAISYTFSSKPTLFTFVRREASTDASYSFNFGQRPFVYTAPANHLALNTFNLPTPTIGYSAAELANEYFDATTYTGNNTTNAITNSGSMQPDFLWIKSRSTAANHALMYSIRGVASQLQSSTTNAESSNSAGRGLQSFNSNGFTLGLESDAVGGTNANGASYVGWQWRASNTTAVTNTNGSITSSVSANTTAGFSIVTYTGTGSTGTVGHGLGVAPKMIISKNRSAAEEWRVGHIGLTNMASWHINLNGSAAQSNSGAAIWNNTTPTSTIFGVGTDTSVSGSGNLIVAYCFSEVAGYSAFGSYTGNASTDGPFIFTGFRPAFVIIKCSSTTGEWHTWDYARGSSNVNSKVLQPNSSNSETDTSDYNIDFLSNGFKIRNASNLDNQSGQTFIYMAFAQSPFKYANAR